MEPERLTRGTGVAKLYSKLELALSSSDRVLYCKCPELCSQWSAHPLGKLFLGPDADQHDSERAEIELEKKGEPFTWLGAKRLIEVYRVQSYGFNNQDRVLVAQGQTACSLRTGSYITPVHFARHQDESVLATRQSLAFAANSAKQQRMKTRTHLVSTRSFTNRCNS